ncbi:MAG: tripartite tricarboxylate transporter TctB family protein [Sphaerochaetaceae bacterium]|nr:tripartite tricarboxylate transporter TctB family protein [Sphaerochaetaceae bacterium]
MLVIEIILMLISILWIAMGFGKYGIWAGQAPGGGLFPVIGGLIVLICCAADIIMRVVKKQPLNGKKFEGEDEYIMLGRVPRQFRPIAVTAYGFISLFLLKYLGFIACAFLTCSVWLIFISKKPVLRSIVTAALTTGFLYGIFVLWLNIPFPKGIF